MNDDFPTDPKILLKRLIDYFSADNWQPTTSPFDAGRQSGRREVIAFIKQWASLETTTEIRHVHRATKATQASSAPGGTTRSP